MSSEIKSKIQQDMGAALRAKDHELLGAIRLLWSAVRQKEIDDRIELDDAQVLGVIEKMIKQRQDSIEQYKAGNRLDLVERESAEMKVLQAYLPEQFSAEKIEELIKKAIAESGAVSIRDMGKVMGILKPQIQGRADVGKVSARIKELLN